MTSDQAERRYIGPFFSCPAATGSSRPLATARETEASRLVAEGLVDTAVPELLVAVDTARVHTQENRDSVTGSAGYLGR